jgi:hypothetical protein
MGSLIPLTRSSALAPHRPKPLALATHQLDLVLDDARLQGLTPAERHAALVSLAQLLLEASGVATREAGHDHE